MATLRNSCRVLQGRACCTLVLYSYLDGVSHSKTCKQLYEADIVYNHEAHKLGLCHMHFLVHM